MSHSESRVTVGFPKIGKFCACCGIALSLLPRLLQAQSVLWAVGQDDNGWPLGNGGGTGAAFVQEDGVLNQLPGSPSSPAMDSKVDNDYYFAGQYTSVIPSNGSHLPLGREVLSDERAAQRALTATDNVLRYHFNLPPSLAGSDLLSITFDPLNLDTSGADPRYGVEVYFNGLLVQSEVLIRPNQVGVAYTTPRFTLGNVNARTGSGFDNIVMLKGISYGGGGGNWMGIDYVQLNHATNGGFSEIPVFTLHPSSASLMLNERAELSAGVEGAPPISFQWHQNGKPLIGQTNTSLALPEFSASVAGDYTVVARNAAGATTSQVAQVTWAATFKNPILPKAADTADPFIAYRDGWHYMVGEQFAIERIGYIFLRKSQSLVGLRNATSTIIQVPTATGYAGCYSPELHFLSGKWYLYFTSFNVTLARSERLFVAESASAQPEGPYVFKAKMAAPGADFWAIDGSVLEEGGKLYFLWAGFAQPGDLVTRVNAGDKFRIFIAPLSNPWTFSGPPTQLAIAAYPWEGHVIEAPVVLRHNGKLHIVYSGAGFGPDYCLGLLTFKGSVVTDANAWIKSPGPLFRRYADEAGQIVGVGHCGFTRSPDGGEDWIVFHNLFPPDADPFVGSREIRLQRVLWNSNDEPFFGHPFPHSVAIPGPSGEAASLALPHTGTGTGLQAEYFSDVKLGALAVSRVDPAVDFDWWSGAPIPTPNGDGFSVRWTGFVQPRYSGAYTFHTVSDDGVRLWVNEQLLVDDWTGHYAKENTGSISLNGGQLYSIRMEYFEAVGDASARLYWSSASQPKEIVPQSQLYSGLETNNTTSTVTFAEFNGLGDNSPISSPPAGLPPGITASWNGLFLHTIAGDTPMSIFSGESPAGYDGAIAFSAPVIVSSLNAFDTEWGADPAIVVGRLAGQEVWRYTSPGNHWFEKVTAGAGKPIDTLLFEGRWNHYDAFVLSAAPTSDDRRDRIEFNGRRLFLSGANVAWRHFGNDIGPDPATPDTNYFAEVFDALHATGGNCLRLWLHTTGEHTPSWSGLTVTGPGSQTINDLRLLLDMAWERKVGLILCLWSFDMLRTNNGPTINNRARNILTNDVGRQSYITNALIPMVQGLKGHPAIIAWEIFNEPEGMSDEFGWEFNQHVPMPAIQKFVNQCAGAIHRADPAAKVSNGSWSFHATTDVGEGNYNYYTDARLVAVGGDPDGYLDFYMVHYYDWAGTNRSPFHHSAAYWGLTKPLVVAEFFPDRNPPNPCVNCGSQPYETLYQNGYAGALAWSWTDSSASGILAHLVATAAAHPAEVLIDTNAPLVSMLAPTNGAGFPVGASVSMAVSAWDPNGTVSKVQFFAGTTLLGEDSTPPYLYDWVNPSAGNHRLFARAIDGTGWSNSSHGIIIAVASAPVANRYEAESAVLTGEVDVQQDGTASGGAYARMQNSGTITWAITNVPASGTYPMIIRFKLFYDTPKTQNLAVNGNAPVFVTFSGPTTSWQQQTQNVMLAAGHNSVQIQKDWGWMYFDYVEFPTLRPNAAPTDITLSSSSVAENQPANTFVGRLSTVDENGGTQFIYTLANGSGSTDNALFNVSGASLRTSAPLNFEAKNTYAVRVRSTDEGGLSNEKTFTVTVADLNEPPSFLQMADLSVGAGMTLMVTNTATDPDLPPQTLTFSLLEGPADASLDPARGILTWRPGVRHANTTNVVRVAVWDSGAPALSATNIFSITVNTLPVARINAIYTVAGGLSLAATGPLGLDYVLLTSTNLVDWEPLFRTTPLVTPFTLVHTNSVGQGARFYRFQLGP